MAEATQGYDALDLLPRAWKIAHTVRRHLPADHQVAAELLMASLGPKLDGTEGFGMAPFLHCHPQDAASAASPQAPGPAS